MVRKFYSSLNTYRLQRLIPEVPVAAPGFDTQDWGNKQDLEDTVIKLSSKAVIFITALALVSFTGLSRSVSAHSLAMVPQQQTGQQQGDQNNKDDHGKKDGKEDINDDRQDGPNDNLQEGPNDERNDDKERKRGEG